MTNIEDQLNKLPKGRLGLKADWRLRFVFLRLRWQKRFTEYSSLLVIKKMAPVVIVAALLLSLVYLPYYAYASEGVVKGNILYPIKQSIEKIELSLADTPAKKIEVYTKLAERRLAEAEKLSEKDSKTANDNLASTIDNMAVLTVEARAEIENELNLEKKEWAINKIAQIKERQLEKMEKIANRFGLQASDNLLDSLALNIDDLKKDKQEKNDFTRILSEVRVSTTTKDYRLFSQIKTEISGLATVSTSTVIIAKPGSASIKIDQTIIAESWDNANDQIAALKESLLAQGVSENEFNNLFNKLDDRLNKAQDSINSGNFMQADGLIKSTEALSNNAKHFLKFNNKATGNIWQATSSPNQATSSINNWRNEIEKRIKDMRGRSNNR
ncbi:MAG: hypothetical protein BWY51_00182 [Parcubacteria group bacterium ADurb.Bin316]|mgnify:CR=1 FL=1|nr:MAG: hypothetical protein BWY51_00182 [Parcubacteria group bacterium ADurb.Bin316]HOZ56184.1 DUF5667 domain-containing protein [bacterium]